jgi:hyperosmotically inducible periplasmic protein
MLRKETGGILLSACLLLMAAADVTARQPVSRPVVEALTAISRLDSFTVFDWIDLAYDRGTMTLRGYASRPGLADDAARAAGEVSGADEVVNEIEVLPALQSDDHLRLRAYMAVYGHPGLSRYAPGGSLTGADLRDLQTWGLHGIEATRLFHGPHPIHIVVAGARVQLFGRVSAQVDRQMAEVQVRALPGVLEVVNRIELERDTP